MRSRFLLIPLVSLFTAFSACAQSPTNVEGAPEIIPPAPPKPGRYVGVVTIHKDLNFEGMTTKVTLRAYAKVDAAGTLTIVAVVPESPVAAAENPQSHVSRGQLQTDGSYLMDGKHRAPFSVQGETFQLSLISPKATILPAPMPEVGVMEPMSPEQQFTLIIGNPVVPPATTRIHYRFYPQRPAAALRTRR